MRLICTGRYRNEARRLDYAPGQRFEASDEEAAFLVADAPGCFEVEPPAEVKAPAEPPRNKQVEAPARAKGRRA